MVKGNNKKMFIFKSYSYSQLYISIIIEKMNKHINVKIVLKFLKKITSPKFYSRNGKISPFFLQVLCDKLDTLKFNALAAFFLMLNFHKKKWGQYFNISRFARCICHPSFIQMFSINCIRSKNSFIICLFAHDWVEGKQHF